jgi:hypothetical protein
MSGLSGQDRTKLRRKVSGILGLSSPEEVSERQEPGQKQSEIGFAEIRPYQEVPALELLSLLKRLRTGEMSWSQVNPVFLPFIHPISALSSNPRTDELYGLMVQLQPYIMPLNPISFEVHSTTPRGATNSRNGDTAKTLGTSSSSDSD